MVNPQVLEKPSSSTFLRASDFVAQNDDHGMNRVWQDIEVMSIRH
jgi:hypothetical protein